jgi:hypothetical protein
MAEQRTIVTEDLRMSVWERLGKGYHYPRIAQELHISVETVGRIAREERSKAKERLADLVTQIQLEQVEQLRYHINESYEAWRRSMQSTKEVQRRTGKRTAKKPMGNESRPVGEVEYDDTTMSSKEQDGDVRYLQEARAAMADLRLMIGANAPQQLNVGIGIAGRIDINVDDMSFDDLTKYMNDMSRATDLMTMPALSDLDDSIIDGDALVYDDEPGAEQEPFEAETLFQEKNPTPPPFMGNPPESAASVVATPDPPADSAG